MFVGGRVDMSARRVSSTLTTSALGGTCITAASGGSTRFIAHGATQRRVAVPRVVTSRDTFVKLKNAALASIEAKHTEPNVPTSDVLGIVVPYISHAKLVRNDVPSIEHATRAKRPRSRKGQSGISSVRSNAINKPAPIDI